MQNAQNFLALCLVDCGDLQFEPGSKFEYSKSGYFLLGAILEEVSGESYEELPQGRIFKPLGMKDSGYAHSETLVQHRAAGYERSPAELQNARYYDMSVPFAAGALYSTVQDLFLWDQALYGERLLPARLRDLLFKPNLENHDYGWVMLVPETVRLMQESLFRCMEGRSLGFNW